MEFKSGKDLDEERLSRCADDAIAQIKNRKYTTDLQLNGVPKTTVLDICSGKSSIGECKARTVLKLSKALNCTMEELMQIDNADYDMSTGKPKNNSYLEKGLPKYLSDSISAMIKSWEIEDSGRKDLHWDIYWCELNADINSAETEQEISSEQAWYLRRKYLRLEED